MHPGSPVYCNRKTHGAGVCTISPHPRAPHLLATGSYDESVRLWDVRVPDRPLMVAQVAGGSQRWGGCDAFDRLGAEYLAHITMLPPHTHCVAVTGLLHAAIVFSVRHWC